MAIKAKAPVRPLYEIAREIRMNWKKSISGTDLNYAAKPFKIPDVKLNHTAKPFVLK